jgi:hypothetical protein
MSEVFDPPAPLQTAVLFLVFNRPDTTQQVFEAIRQAKPPRLYVAADGPRAGREGEAERTTQVRKIATAVDWPCEVKTLFRKENLGCKKAVSGGIDWFFENEEQGIILEDDCYPHPDFFFFCEWMLARYKNDVNIGMISGFNPQGINVESDEYFQSKNALIWGWATWQSRWKKYDINMIMWDMPSARHEIREQLGYKVNMYYKLSFGLTKKGILNTWDYQWAFCQMLNKQATIKPVSNLVKNIGVEGVHAVGSDKNHNTPHGNFKNKIFTRNDVIGPIQDACFYKYNLPSTFTIFSKYMIFKIGIYEVAKKIKLALIANRR